jgi:hypothetical protein
MNNKKPIRSDNLILPRAALIHHISNSESEYGIGSAHPLLLNDTLPVRVYHVDELEVVHGRPLKKTINTMVLMNDYFKNAPGLFTRVRRMDRTIKEVRSVLVLDYSLLPVKYYYPKTKTSFFDELDNIYSTQVKQINEIGDSREQFIVFKMPEVLPEYAKLRMLPDPIPPGRLNEWHDTEAYGLLYVWRLLNKQSLINDSAKSKLTIVFQEGSFITQINLADLFAWYNENPTTVEKSLYRVWLNLRATRIGEVELVDEEGNVVETTDADLEVAVKDDAFDDVIEKDDFVNTAVLNDTMRDLAEAGRLSGAEQKRFTSIATSYKDIQNPMGPGTIGDLINVPKEVKVLSSDTANIADKPGLLDKSMTKSTIKDFTKKYVNEVMAADIVSSVLAVQNAGVLVKDYKVENKFDAINNYDVHTVSLIPINGKPSTLSFKLPVVDENGEFIAGGVKSRLDNQKFDLPIRKINPSRVALSSYYGKAFVDRSGVVVNNYSRWIIGKLTASYMDVNDKLVKTITFSNAKPPKLDLPRAYTAVSVGVLRFAIEEYSFHFGYDTRKGTYGESVVTRVEEGGAVICGKSNTEKDVYLSMGIDGFIYKVLPNNSALPLGYLPEVINPNWGPGPVEYAEMKIFGKRVPVVLVLGYLMGLDRILEKLNVPHRWAEGVNQTKFLSHEARFRFNKESLIIDKRHTLGSLIVGGLRALKSISVEYDGSAFNKKEVYGILLDSLGYGRHILKEIGLMNKMFIDPITKEILRDMKEPDVFTDLTIRAVELLANDNSPDEMDPRFMRIRGYERFSGFVYKRVVEAVRIHENSYNPSKSQVSINPNIVWNDVISDTAITLVEESNPIHNLKEMESVTFSGQGGRSGETMVASTRVFHQNDVGLISESTPDSSKVGIRAHMPPNAKLTSIRGLSERFDYGKDTLTSALSSTALLNPGSIHMDGKRVIVVYYC